MKKILLFLPLILLAMAGLSVVSAHAQTETPPEVGEWIGQVEGALINQNLPDAEPGIVEIMLHAWDQNGSEKMMLHGETEPDGRFAFVEVPFEEGLLFSVMAVYQGANYFSEPVAARQGQANNEVAVPIYETKTDLGGVQIDQTHILFYFTQGGLGVTEVHILSNLSDRTVRDAVVLDDGEKAATLLFALPSDASNVTFNTQDSSRFLVLPGGFADTAPLVPGQAASQIMVSYVLPYENAQTYVFAPNVPVQGVNILVDAAAGLSLEGEDLISKGVQTLQDGSEFNVYDHVALETGEQFQIDLTGAPRFVAVPNATMGETTSVATATSTSLAVGGLIFGLVLLGIGVWWLRSQEPAPAVDLAISDEASLDEIIASIARLDHLQVKEGLPEERYQQMRRQLLQEAKSLLDAETIT